MLKTKSFLIKVAVLGFCFLFKISVHASPSLLSPQVSKPFSNDPNFCDFNLEYTYFDLCYSNLHRQSLWAQHILTREQIKGPQGRTNNFRSDPRVSNPVNQNDFKGSGFDRGHLVPAADMKLNQTSMSETFFMTNMSPQNPNFNSGIWNALEGYIRNEVSSLGPAVIITAPVLLKTETYPMIRSQVTVPSEYYKIAYFYESDIIKAFLIPNQPSNGKKYSAFQISVDEIENLTGLDFFSDLEDQIESALESGL